ncbi:proteoglycan 4-like [Scyliorhinus canicula]|uniref:proteoglycan 4-like n=1 Tax=Scyliorhinus canicula TaxID=7830 RepID=UPI0018F421C0|nr:proteoglycan 4-like [Scyliorhinus canicula]
MASAQNMDGPEIPEVASDPIPEEDLAAVQGSASNLEKAGSAKGSLKPPTGNRAKAGFMGSRPPISSRTASTLQSRVASGGQNKNAQEQRASKTVPGSGTSSHAKIMEKKMAARGKATQENKTGACGANGPVGKSGRPRKEVFTDRGKSPSPPPRSNVTSVLRQTVAMSKLPIPKPEKLPLNKLSRLDCTAPWIQSSTPSAGAVKKQPAPSSHSTLNAGAVRKQAVPRVPNKRQTPAPLGAAPTGDRSRKNPAPLGAAPTGDRPRKNPAPLGAAPTGDRSRKTPAPLGAAPTGDRSRKTPAPLGAAPTGDRSRKTPTVLKSAPQSKHPSLEVNKASNAERPTKPKQVKDSVLPPVEQKKSNARRMRQIAKVPVKSEPWVQQSTPPSKDLICRPLKQSTESSKINVEMPSPPDEGLLPSREPPSESDLGETSNAGQAGLEASPRPTDEILNENIPLQNPQGPPIIGEVPSPQGAQTAPCHSTTRTPVAEEKLEDERVEENSCSLPLPQLTKSSEVNVETQSLTNEGLAPSRKSLLESGSAGTDWT